MATAEAGATDTAASATDEEDDDASCVSSGSDGLSDTSGLMVRIKQKAASADEDEMGYGHHDRNVRLVAGGRSRDASSGLGEGHGSRRRAGRSARQPRTNYVTLFPGQQVEEPYKSDDETRSLPDLPSLRTSLPTLRTTQGRQHQQQRSQQYPARGSRRRPPTSVVWQDLQQPSQDIKLSYRYYDFRRLTRPRKKRHKRRNKSRSPSRARAHRRGKASRRAHQTHKTHSTHNNEAHHNPGPPIPSNSSQRTRPRRMVAGGGFNVSRMVTPPRGGEAGGSRFPAPRRAVRMIDVNQLTIGGYREHVNIHRWQASPRRPPVTLPASPPPLLRRFLDPHAPLF